MELLSCSNLFFPVAKIPTQIPSFTISRLPKFLFSRLTPPSSLAVAASAAASSSSYSTAASPISDSTQPNLSSGSWERFASRVSGEWDGFGAEFTTEGAPVELPENVVPGAFREWGVQVFDWQTQCPTLAESKDAGTALSYKLIKLLPTVGCEADAATRHSVEERAVGGSGNLASAFGYDSGTGSYVAIWPVQGGIELEHCLVDPRDREARLRVVQVVRRKRTEEGEGMKLEKLKVFSEHWDGPFRNGELLGGCAIRNSAFASTAALGVSEVVGLWQGTSLVAAKLGSEETDILHELVPEKPCNTIRVTPGLVPLPKQLWCSFKETEDDETLCEVGWLMDPGTAMTSRCIFSSNGVLKEMAIGSEILSSKGT